MMFKWFGFQMDLARRLERPSVIERAVESLAHYGYNTCVLYLEDACRYPRHPKLARPNSYSIRQMKHISKVCSDSGLELIPVIPALGHAEWVTGKRGYEHFDEGYPDNGLCGTLRAGDERVYKLIRELFQDWCENIPGNFLHAGLDESPAIERPSGQGPDSIKQTEELFAAHTNRLRQEAENLGRRLMIWGDMLYYLPGAIRKINSDIVVCDWYYYSFRRFPKVEVFNFKEIDLSGELKKAGFAVWGVPSVWPNRPIADINDRYRHFSDWLRYAKSRSLEGLLVTDWENHTGFFSQSEMLFRLMGLMANAKSGARPLPSLLRNQVLPEMAGVKVSRKFVQSLLRLGRWNLTGHQHDRCLGNPLAMARRSPRDRREQESACKELAGLFNGNPWRRLRHTGIFEATRLSWQFISLYWNCRRLFSDLLETSLLKFHQMNTAVWKKKLTRLSAGLTGFGRDYKSHWRSVRFMDDGRPIPVLVWAHKTLDVLKTLEQLLSSKTGEEEICRSFSSLTIFFLCRYPALPVAKIRIIWAGNRVQEDSEIMIRFNSQFARSYCPWEQAAVVPLNVAEWPDAIEIINEKYYGEFGIKEVFVHLGKIKRRYQLEKTWGHSVKQNKHVLWMGVKGARAGAPLIRSENEGGRFVQDSMSRAVTAGKSPF